MSLKVTHSMFRLSPQLHSEEMKKYAHTKINNLPDYDLQAHFLNVIREIKVTCGNHTEAFFTLPLKEREIQVLTEGQLTEKFTQQFQEFAMHHWTSFEIFLFIYLITEDENAERNKKDFYHLLEKMVTGTEEDKKKAQVDLQKKINANVELKDFLRIAFFEFMQEMEATHSKCEKVNKVFVKVLKTAFSPLTFALKTGYQTVEKLTAGTLARDIKSRIRNLFNLESWRSFEHKKEIANFLIKLSAGYFTAGLVIQALSSNEETSQDSSFPISDVVFGMVGSLGEAINLWIDFGRNEKSPILHLGELFGTITQAVLSTALTSSIEGLIVKGATEHASLEHQNGNVEHGKTGYEFGQEMVDFSLAMSAAASSILKKVPTELMREQERGEGEWVVLPGNGDKEDNDEGIQIRIRVPAAIEEEDSDIGDDEMPTLDTSHASSGTLLRMCGSLKEMLRGSTIAPSPDEEVVVEAGLTNPLYGMQDPSAPKIFNF